MDFVEAVASPPTCVKVVLSSIEVVGSDRASTKEAVGTVVVMEVRSDSKIWLGTATAVEVVPAVVIMANKECVNEAVLIVSPPMPDEEAKTGPGREVAWGVSLVE